ncbi:sensor histidine kinase [Miniphocaeibacter halophilus]|uniref:HAMP domain-containing histidine kinase n=1 Tax=Miniphocaeibacter halophilus TaxID=2931922 RepID=A0AC61MML7_9FIRM|nr:HAMP domain-containing sensor histidine kinase [Miniphocaeibacter halophilus]QQK06906.1 HAMP domain-containing histidine kinase [Miniphocaeibacter halophilus]
MIFKLYINKKNIKNLIRQIKEIRLLEDSNKLLTSLDLSDSTTELIEEINKLIEENTKSKKEAKKQNLKFKEEVTNLSHDFRTPVTSIKGFVELIQDGSISEEEKEEYINIVNNKINILTDTVEAFYEISKYESEDYKIELEPLSLYEVAVENIIPFYEDFNKKNIDVEIKIDENIPKILLDKRASSRIFINLVQNALTYAESYFKLEIVEEECLKIIAKNNSNNINEKIIDKIFDRTFMGRDFREAGRFGLGLYIVKELVVLQNGKIDANYENNEFTIEICF